MATFTIYGEALEYLPIADWFHRHVVQANYRISNGNLVTEYNHECAVTDSVNVGYKVYRIKTNVAESGGKVSALFSMLQLKVLLIGIKPT